MECSDQKKRVLLYLTEKLMKEANVEIRDTWMGHRNENIEVQKTPGDGQCFFVAEKEELDGNKSFSYTNPIIVLAEKYGGTLHPVVHEAVHYLQHNNWEMDNAYFKRQKYDDNGFKKFVSQREETEAYFIQLLFVSRYETHIVKERDLLHFQKRVRKALQHPAMRVDTICWVRRMKVLKDTRDNN